MSVKTPRIHPVAMPRWGMTMTEGTLCAWLIGEGAAVEAGQELMEIETTKITNVVESQVSGVLRRQVLARGATAPVGALLGVIADPAVPDDEIAAFVGTYAASDAEDGAEADGGAAPRSVETGRGPINVLSVGAGAGHPVLLVHGFGGDLATWALNQEALADGRTVHAFDLPAHGGTAPSDAQATDELADVTGALLDALGVDRVHLVGHSLGGAVALLAAANRPERIASLTLIAPVGLGPQIDASYVEGFLAAERRKPMKEVLGKLYKDPERVSGDMIEAVLRFKRLDGVPEALRAIAAGFSGQNGQALDLRPQLAALDVPVLVVWGADDAIVPSAHAEGLAAKVVLVPEAGHMPQVEDAAAVNRAVAAHIAAAEGQNP